MNEFHYVGSELELFANAKNWKSYWSKQLQPFLGGEVLEVGAGIGANTQYLQTSANQQWTCLEPDRSLAAQLRTSLDNRSARSNINVIVGTITDVDPKPQFSTILYIDVLEHIEKDSDELGQAMLRLKPGGFLVVLSPAHSWLFSDFDRNIGHFRRYTKKDLRAIEIEGLRLHRLRYLDSCGLIASASNRLFLRQSMPSLAQIKFWDKFLVPPSRLLDPLLIYAVGKSVLGVWQKI